MMVPNPNFIYYLVIFAWPIFAIWIYKKYALDQATILLFIIPYLLFPVPHPYVIPLDLPLLPPLDKKNVPVLVAFGVLVANRVKIDWLPKSGYSTIFCLSALLSPTFTLLANRDPIIFPGKIIPAMNLLEIASLYTDNLLKVYIPFVIGFTLLGTENAHHKLVKVIFVSGLVYSLLMIYEIRMSPQLHRYFYGYHPHEFVQQRRGDGFRAMVFLGHGLLTAFFCCLTLMAAFALRKSKDALMVGGRIWILMYLVLVLILSKTYSAVIYFLFYLGATLFLSRKMSLRLLASIGLMVLLYPYIRSLMPLAELTELFNDINPERASSLQFRFDNEERLLSKGWEKPWFGWGTWGRNRVYDPETGTDLSVTDGMWIINFGMFGWLGYIGIMGLLVYPLIALFKLAKRNVDISVYTMMLAFVVAIYALDQIPNASSSYLTYLISGALLGRIKQLSETAKAPMV